MRNLHRLQPDRWIITPRPVPQAKLQLFCFPFAGGGISAFTPWIPHFPPEIEVSLVLLPGRENRFKESRYTELHHLIQDLSEVMVPFLKRPYVLYGHSMGGLISFELARQFRRRGLPLPAQLFISSHRAPHLPSRFPPMYKLPATEFWETLRLLKGTPDEILNNPEMVELVTPILRSDFQMCDTYHYAPEPPLPCPLSVYGGVDDPRILHQDLEGWSMHTQAEFQLQLLEGGHFFIHDPQSNFLDKFSQRLTHVLFDMN